LYIVNDVRSAMPMFAKSTYLELFTCKSFSFLAIQVPVVTATISIDRSCQYHDGTFPYFKGLADSVM